MSRKSMIRGLPASDLARVRALGADQKKKGSGDEIEPCHVYALINFARAHYNLECDLICDLTEKKLRSRNSGVCPGKPE